MKSNSILLGIFFSSIIFGYLLLNNIKNGDCNKSIFYDYLVTINQNMYKVKLNNYSHILFFNEFCKLYKKAIKYPTKEQLELLKTKIEQCDKLITISTLKQIPWKFLISHNNLEGDMPFTISNRIVIPENKINSIKISTLIHEKIHVLQRKYQSQFNSIYIKMYPFLYRMYDDKIIPLILKMKNMNNPDGNNTYWVYYLKNRYWLPLLIYDDELQNYEERAYEVKYDKNKNILNIEIKSRIILRELFDNMPNFISLYHPNEIFACELGHAIVNKDQIHPNLEEIINNL